MRVIEDLKIISVSTSGVIIYIWLLVLLRNRDEMNDIYVLLGFGGIAILLFLIGRNKATYPTDLDDV